MSFKVESSIEKFKKKTKYTLQITTDNYEQFLFMQKVAEECINGDVNSDSETVAEHYDYQKFDYPKWVKSTEFNYPKINLTDIPACCVNCSNHPSNGGSGICNCAAPYLNQVTCGSYSINNNGTEIYGAECSTADQNS